MAIAPDIESIISHPDTGLIPFLEETLDGNWNRFFIKPWFPKSSLPRECGYRFREASSVVEDDKRKVTQVVALGRVFFMEDHTEAVLEGLKLQNDIDEAILHWSKYRCPWLLGSVESFEGGGLGPEQNTSISSDHPYAWAVYVIRYFSISYYGISNIIECDI
jgi:hypothetical protein